MGNSFNDDERCVLAGYDNGDVKLFDMRTNKVRVMPDKLYPPEGLLAVQAATCSGASCSAGAAMAFRGAWVSKTYYGAPVPQVRTHSDRHTAAT